MQIPTFRLISPWCMERILQLMACSAHKAVNCVLKPGMQTQI